MKIILAGGFADEEQKRRFEWEAEAVARLSHPNIVHIFEAGLEEGFPFFSMQYVERGSLDKVENRKHFSTSGQIGSCIKTLAEALEHAHSKGVIHRDLKPSNILLNEEGHVFISDFGLSVSADSQSRVTITGRVLGSLGYIAPEQLLGDSAPSTSLDIYALGGILYFLLTGKPPTKSVSESLNSDPQSPRQIDKSIPLDLEKICLKCLEKEPGLRYSSAAALAEDLERFLGNYPVKARPIGLFARGWRLVERHRLLASIVGVSLIVAATTLAFGLFKSAAAVRSNRELKELAVALSLGEANARIAEGNTRDGIVRLVETARRFSGDSRASQRLRSAIQYRKRLVLTNQLQIASDKIRLASFSPAGSEIALVSPEGTIALQRLDGGHIDTLKVSLSLNDSVAGLEFNAQGACLLLITTQGRIYFVDLHTRVIKQVGDPAIEYRNAALRNDGRFLATKGRDGTVYVFDTTNDYQPLWTEHASPECQDLAFDSQGEKLVIERDETVFVKSAATGQMLTSFKGIPASPQSLILSPNNLFVAVMAQNEVAVLDFKTGVTLLNFASTNGFKQIAFSEDSKYVFAGGDKSCEVWEVSTGTKRGAVSGIELFFPAQPFVNNSPLVAYISDSRDFHLWNFIDPSESFDRVVEDWVLEDVAISPRGDYFLTLTGSTNANLWTKPRESSPVAFSRHQSRIRVVKFTSDDDALFTTSNDGYSRFWNIPTLNEKFVGFDHGAGVTAAAVSADNRRLATGTGTGLFRLLDVQSGKDVISPTNFSRAIEHISFVRTDAVLASVTQDDFLRFHDAENGAMLSERRLREGDGTWVNRIFEMRAHEGLHLLGIACGNGSAQIWDTKTLDRRHLAPHPAPVTSIDFARSGRTFATGCMDGFARIWDTASCSNLVSPLYHGLEVTAARFTPDARQLLTTSFDRRARLWDSKTGRLLLQTETQPDRLTCGEFSPDGSLFATGSTDGSVVIWDSKTGLALSERFRHSSAVSRIAFSRNGKFLACGFWDGLVELHEIDQTALPPSELVRIERQYSPGTLKLVRPADGK